MERSHTKSRIGSLIVTAALMAACAAPTAVTPPKAPAGADASRAPAPPAVSVSQAGRPVASPAATARPAGPYKPEPIIGSPPSRPIEFVISTSPGGGSDVYARFMIGIAEKFGLSPQPLLPVNKDGGAGAVAMQYLDAKKDPPALMITLNSFITTPMLQKLPFNAESFTPVSLLALDSFFLWVPAASPYKTLDDFVKAAKERELAVAGTGSKQEDEILFKLVEMRAGTKPFKYVPLRGGGDVCAALAEGQVEATVNNPSECKALHPDKVRPLAAFLDERSPAFGGLPTAKEQGLNITYANMRAVVASPGLSRGQQQWYVGLMRQVFDSPDWQEFVQKNALEAKFLGGDEFARFLLDYERVHRELITASGWLQ